MRTRFAQPRCRARAAALAALLLLAVSGSGAPPGAPPFKSLGRVEAKLTKVEHWVGHVDLSPDGTTAAYATTKGVFVVSYPDGKLIRAMDIKGAELSFAAVSFSADGKKLVGAFPSLRVWDIESGKILTDVQFDWMPKETKDRPKGRPAVSRDAKLAVVPGLDKRISVWDLDKGKELVAGENPFGKTLSLALSPDGKTFAAGTSAGVWMAETATLKTVWRGELKEDVPSRGGYRVSFAPDGKRLYIIGPHNRLPANRERDELLIWDVAKKEYLDQLPYPEGFRGATAAVPSADGRYVLTTYSRSPAAVVVCLHDLKTGQLVGGVGIPETFSAYPARDGTRILTGTTGNQIAVVSVEDILKLLPKEAEPKKP